MAAMLKTFLKELGGVSKVTADLQLVSGHEIEENAVYQWSYRDTIPHRWRFHVAKLAKKKKIKDVPPEVKEFMS